MSALLKREWLEKRPTSSISTASTPLPPYEAAVDIASTVKLPVRKLSASTEEECQSGRDALDDLIDLSESLLASAHDVLSSTIESREHLRRFYALDTAFERSLMLSEHEIRRRISKAGIAELEQEVVEARPSLLSTSAAREAPQAAISSVELSPSQELASSPIAADLTTSSLFSPSSFYASWMGSSQPAPAQQSAKDALSALQQSSKPAAPASPPRSKHRRADGLPTARIDLERAGSAPALLSRSMPAQPSEPAGQASSPARVRPQHERKPSKQPSLTSEGLHREATPRRDDTHARRSGMGKESMTARDRLLGALSGRV